MPAPITPPSKSPTSDFNNDGVADYLGKISWGEKVRGTWYCGMIIDDVPHLKPHWTTDTYWKDEAAGPFNKKCAVIKNSAGSVKAWVFSSRLAPAGRDNGQFFTSDRTMWFAMNMPARRREGGKSEFVRGIIILLDTKTRQQAGPPYAQFGNDCALVSIEDLIWVTKSQKPLDMRLAIRLARQSDPIAEDVAKTLEGQVAQLVRRIEAVVAGLQEASPEAKRDAVIKLAKESPLNADLPDRWEASLLQVLGLPLAVPKWVTQWARDPIRR